MIGQPLTKRQKEVYDFLASFIAEKGYAPSLEEIGTALNLRALATIHKHLENLKDKGWILRQFGMTRSITLTNGATHCPTCGRMFDASRRAS